MKASVWILALMVLSGCATEADQAIELCKTQQATEANYNGLKKRMLCDADVSDKTWDTKITKVLDPEDTYGKYYGIGGVSYTIDPGNLKEEKESHHKEMVNFANFIGDINECAVCLNGESGSHDCHSACLLGVNFIDPRNIMYSDVEKVVERWEGIIKGEHIGCDSNASVSYSNLALFAGVSTACTCSDEFTLSFNPFHCMSGF